MADHEKDLVSKILFTENVSDVVGRKIHSGMFVDNNSKRVFDFLIDHYVKYGEVPAIDLVEKEFPRYALSYPKEPVDYYIDKLVENYVRNKSSEILVNNTKKLVTNPLDGLDDLQKEFASLHVEANPTDDANILESTESRKQKYLDLKNMKGVDGHPSPWEVLNRATMGWHPEEFIVIVARPKIGKTWMLTIFAEYAWANDLTILFVSNEMATQQIERRFDSLHFKLPYEEFKSGLLADALEERYFKGLDELERSGKSPMWTVGNIGGVTAIGAKIDEYKPDIVLIDGLYQLPDDKRGANKWERTSNISWDLKQLARKKKLPIIATTQFNRIGDESNTKFDEVNLSMLGFSDSIGQDADVVLGLFRNKDMLANNELYVRMLALREGEPKDFILRWDLHRMIFDVISEDDSSEVIEDGEIDEDAIEF